MHYKSSENIARFKYVTILQTLYDNGSDFDETYNNNKNKTLNKMN